MQRLVERAVLCATAVLTRSVDLHGCDGAWSMLDGQRHNARRVGGEPLQDQAPRRRTRHLRLGRRAHDGGRRLVIQGHVATGAQDHTRTVQRTAPTLHVQPYTSPRLEPRLPRRAQVDVQGLAVGCDTYARAHVLLLLRLRERRDSRSTLCDTLEHDALDAHLGSLQMKRSHRTGRAYEAQAIHTRLQCTRP